MGEHRVIIVGAGPAGVRAAQAVVRAGLRPIVIDEASRAGGQIYRRPPENFKRDHEALYGTEAARARAIHEDFAALLPHIDYRPETLVWNVAEGHVWAAHEGETQAIPYNALIVCSGASDRVAPIKGWQAAGCYSLGGAQIALKAQGCAIGHRVIFLGSGPLLYLAAAQYVKAGAEVAAVLDTSPFWLRVKAAPKLAAMPELLWQGVKLLRDLKRAGVPVLTGVTPVEIEGDPQNGVSGVTVRHKGAVRHFAGDAVAMGWHVKPEAQIADLARATFAFDPATRQWLPQTDADGRAGNALYLGGDGARVLGARSAEVTGELAAMAALADLGLTVDADRRRWLLAEKANYATFAKGLAQAFPWPHELVAAIPDDAIVCRCEAVTAAALRASVSTAHAQEANRAKAFSRVGMGRCQGRYCGHASAEIIAAARAVSLEKTGRLRGQAPVKPIPVSLKRNDI
ncbi:NAD(P)/FAD-dependent oxidoreductase [Novosphingobium sediminicola]|uniref:NADPH-dependent 2,4-dienoyl-CoA reductase/sulfur reductase-like enzyme n=1 Tax=Novosphingobium sediminicola TaxID=563162 RepID=A0A7W6CDL0_9SPHN|nr:NAD(P)/FAD-dependent oxidoreductase [Novosphingobium sediminicola]MBB3954571.1 NADPH-dependent 2,4-dienoyl-CoA reductase/sulfur reductase-like enzyme [Novosphingobium sediminicola]